MTDMQVETENKKDGKIGAEKAKLKFMQKYYHKGAFYVGDEKVEGALSKIDSTAPTLEDHGDKTILPQIMQVKNFGMAGRTKYTHLVDQDTTGLDNPWSNPDNVTSSVHKKMGGIGNSQFSKPAIKKRKAD